MNSVVPETTSMHVRDPWLLSFGVAALFAILAWIRLAIPSEPYFDEVHYLPAARAMLEGGTYLNREHPLLGKQLIALGITLFGDHPMGWRAMSLIAGALALFASMRAMWHASFDRFATLAFGVLLATGFHLLVHARIAMLDVFMAAFLSLAAWQFAAAIREPERGRWRLALTGIAVGLAMAAKWNAVPLAVLPGLIFFAARLSAGRKHLLTSTRGIPVPGISLAEAFLWLGIVPLAVYALTYWPAYDLLNSPLAEKGLFGLHSEMIELQASVKQPHPYQSTWPQWLLNARGIWYLYEFTDNAQRGVLLIGNPLTMLLGLPALLWCLISGVVRGEWAKTAMVIGFAASLGLWLIANKPIQFYYHYFMPSMFLLGALALSLSDLHRSAKYRWMSYAVLVGSIAMFAGFFTILTAGELEGPMSFAKWTWMVGWR
ncbi:MAG: phospholipid carrier-dependent glycosyltransferase [Pseudomonadota bacterium]